MPPADTVTAASRLPPTALDSELPRYRASAFIPLAEASSFFGVLALINDGKEE